MSYRPEAINRAIAAKVIEAAGNYGLTQEALVALMKEIPARATVGDNVFEVGEPWAGSGDAFATFAFFEGEGDGRLGRYRPGDIRAYLIAHDDGARAALAASGATPFLAVTVGEMRSTRRFYAEDDFVDAVAREWAWMFKALQAPFVGDGSEDDDGDTECEECGAQTRLWTDPDPNDPDTELERQDAAKYCGNCGTQFPLEVEVLPS